MASKFHFHDAPIVALTGQLANIEEHFRHTRNGSPIICGQRVIMSQKKPQLCSFVKKTTGRHCKDFSLYFLNCACIIRREKYVQFSFLLPFGSVMMLKTYYIFIFQADNVIP